MSNEKKIIGICGARIFDQIPMQFINTLREVSLDYDYYPLAFTTYSYFDVNDNNSIGESQLFGLLRFVNLSGLIVLTETIKAPFVVDGIVRLGHSLNIPVFSFDGSIEDCYNLLMDYHNGFEQMVRHIVEEHGCKHVNMLAGFQGNAFSDERILIYKKVLKENGIPFEEERLAYGDFWEQPARMAMEQFLADDKELPEAIVCANDTMALVACSVLEEHGYSIPEDILITGFDGTKNAKYHYPIITTGEPDYRGAAEFIIKEIDKVKETGIIQPSDYTMKFTVEGNQSCGCKPKVFHKINRILSSLSKDVGDCTWHNIAMNNMVNSVMHKKNIMDIATVIPDYVNLWSDCFRFACVKSSLLSSCEARKDCREMVTILRDNKGVFDKPGELFQITDFVPRLNDIIEKDNDIDILVIRTLHSEKDIYGYVVEGFQSLDDRRLQRCNEFAMFLIHSIDTVIYNYKMAELNENLTQAYKKISSLYNLDPMTGIYNRRGFFENLDKIIESPANIGKYLYIFSIDMDGLKNINDTFGHGEGDFAIITLSEAIEHISGESAICSRFGGDEFVCLILADSDDAYDMQSYSRNLQNAIAQADGVSEKRYTIAASVGMVSQKITENFNIDDMLLAADRLMYDDKIARKKQRLQ